MGKLRYVAVGLILLLIGCNISDMDFSNLKVESTKMDLAFPFGSATYTMRELLDEIADSDLTLEEDPVTAELKLLYNQSANYSFSTNILDIQNIVGASIFTLNNTVGPGTFNQSIPLNHLYEPVKKELVDSIYHGSTSNLNVQLTSSSLVSMNYALELTGIQNRTTGLPLVFNGTLTGGGPGIHAQNLTNYKSIFNTTGGASRLQGTLTIDANLGALEQFSGDVVEVVITYNDQEFLFAFGKFGKDTVDISSGTVDIDLFENFGVAGLDFGEPEITFDFNNSLGVPFGIGFSRLYGEEPDGSRTYLNGSIATSPPVVLSSSITPPITGAVQQTILKITPSNSTLRTLLATSPSRIGFDLRGFTNPYSTPLNFVTTTSSIDAEVEVSIPLSVRMVDVKHELYFDIPGGVDLGNADSVILRLVTVNDLPFRANLDLHIVDDMDQILYEVLDNVALGQPFLNIDRTVREPKISADDVPLGSAGIEALKTASKIKVTLTMNSPESVTSQPIFVKLLATAEIKVTLGARAIFNTDL